MIYESTAPSRALLSRSGARRVPESQTDDEQGSVAQRDHGLGGYNHEKHTHLVHVAGDRWQRWL